MYPELIELPFVHLTIKSYGMMMVIGFLSAVFIIRRLSRDITPNPQYITNAALYSLIAGVVGARLFYVVHYFDHFKDNPLSALYIWEGGLELLGGVILAITVIFFYLAYHKLPIRRYLDILAIGLMLALAFGRIGCFLNGCCFGKPTDLPWAVRFPYRHPHLVHSPAYNSQVHPNFARNRPYEQLKLPADYFDYYEKSFDINVALQSDLDNQIVSKGLQSEFKNNGVTLPRYSRISTEQPGRKWLLTGIEDKYTLTKYEDRIEVYGKIRYLKPYEDLTEQQKAEVTKGQYRCLPVHPTELYSSAAGGILFLLLYLFWRRTQKAEKSVGPAKLFAKPGCTFGLMFVVYGIARFFIEFLRDDNPFEFARWALYKGATVSQNIGIYMVIFGLILMLIFNKMKTQRPK